MERAVGPLGTSLNAILDGTVVGAFEVEDDHTRGGGMVRLDAWADEANHWVREDLRGQGVGTWLVQHGARWLRLGGTTRFLTYAIVDDRIDDKIRYYARYGLTPINRTRRGWTRQP